MSRNFFTKFNYDVDLFFSALKTLHMITTTRNGETLRSVICNENSLEGARMILNKKNQPSLNWLHDKGLYDIFVSPRPIELKSVEGFISYKRNNGDFIWNEFLFYQFLADLYNDVSPHAAELTIKIREIQSSKVKKHEDIIEEERRQGLTQEIETLIISYFLYSERITPTQSNMYEIVFQNLGSISKYIKSRYLKEIELPFLMPRMKPNRSDLMSSIECNKKMNSQNVDSQYKYYSENYEDTYKWMNVNGISPEDELKSHTIIGIPFIWTKTRKQVLEILVEKGMNITYSRNHKNLFEHSLKLPDNPKRHEINEFIKKRKEILAKCTEEMVIFDSEGNITPIVVEVAKVEVAKVEEIVNTKEVPFKFVPVEWDEDF